MAKSRHRHWSEQIDAVERLGPDDTQEILDQVRAAIVALRESGAGTGSERRI